MRDYFKIYRTPDFRTVIGKLAPGQDEKDFELLAMISPPKDGAIVMYNRIAAAFLWTATDADGNIIDLLDGPGFANLIWSCIKYENHPAQDGPYGTNGPLEGQKKPSPVPQDGIHELAQAIRYFGDRLYIAGALTGAAQCYELMNKVILEKISLTEALVEFNKLVTFWS